jgi:hypothetical protein
MKKLTRSLGWIALLAVIFSHQVRAEMIVNTGTPNQLGSPLMLTDAQWLAAEFSTTQAWQLNSLEGFINADTLNPASATYTIALYGNGLNNHPDTNNELFSQQATFASDGWNGLQGLNLALDAGTYWLAFEVRVGDTLQGLMPVFAPNPVQTAYNDTTANFGYALTSGVNYNFGVQISAVPVPSALWLFVSGLFAVARLGKRKAI